MTGPISIRLAVNVDGQIELALLDRETGAVIEKSLAIAQAKIDVLETRLSMVAGPCGNHCAKLLDCGGRCRLALNHEGACLCPGDEDGPGTCPA